MSDEEYDSERSKVISKKHVKTKIIEEDSISDNIEYVLSSQEDGMVAYRIVTMSDDDTRKPSIVQTKSTVAATQTTITATATVPQQYIVINNVTGYLQAIPTPTALATKKPIAISSNSTTSASSIPINTTRPSIAIAPKIVKAETTKNIAAATKAINVFKKRDDRRRATHNEVERRRRYKINHWIMKLGSIIPADGSTNGIGDNSQLSIANVEGQSKGGILSKACDYIQMLQKNKSDRNQSPKKTTIDKKGHEEEIARLKNENEMLKSILIKHGISYAKERSSSNTDGKA